MEANATNLSVQDRILAWVETRKNEIRWGVIIVLVVGVAGGFFVWHQNEKRAAANAALSSVARRNLVNAPASEPVEALLKVAAEYPNTDAGARALLLAGGGLFREGKYQEARAQFERYLRDYGNRPFADQALLGAAACLDAQGKTNEAVAAYADIIQHHANENIAPQAKLALARLYESQNKLQQARDLYQELTSANYGLMSSEASVRFSEMLADHPNLAHSDLAAGGGASTNLPLVKPENP